MGKFEINKFKNSRVNYLSRFYQNSNMTSNIIRFIFLGKQTLTEIIKAFLETDAGMQLQGIWSKRTRVISYEDNMLTFINNRTYDFIYNECNTVAEESFRNVHQISSTLTECKEVEVPKVNLLNRMQTMRGINKYNTFLHNTSLKDSEIYKSMRNPLQMFKEEIINTKRCYVCLPSFYNYTTQQLVTNTIQKNFYIKKLSVKTEPNLIQEMHNIHLHAKPKTLKFRYVVYNAEDGRRKYTTTYVDVTDYRTLVKKVVQTLLENPPLSTKCLSTRLSTLESSRLLLALIEKENGAPALSSLNQMQLLLLLQQCQAKKRNAEDASNNGIAYISLFSNFFDSSINKDILNCNTLNIFRDDIISHITTPSLNCSRIDYDEIKQKKLILDVNKEAFDNLEQTLKNIKIIDKMEEQADRKDEDDEQTKFHNIQSELCQIYLFKENFNAFVCVLVGEYKNILKYLFKSGTSLKLRRISLELKNAIQRIGIEEPCYALQKHSTQILSACLPK